MGDEGGVAGVVLDNGSGMVRCGFAGDDAPRAVFPNITGGPKHSIISSGCKDLFIGDDCFCRKGIVQLKKPHVQNGIVTDFDLATHVWHHSFYNELRVDPQGLSVTLCDAAHAPRSQREKTAEIMFEEFNVGSLALVPIPVCTIFASGREYGVAVNCGYRNCTASVVHDQSFVLPATLNQNAIGGDDVSKRLQQLLNERGMSYHTRQEVMIVDDIKRHCCSVALNHADALNGVGPAAKLDTYDMYGAADYVLELESERTLAPELLFSPQMGSLRRVDRQDTRSIQDLVRDAVAAFPDDEFRAEMLKNVVIEGGTTMFNGFAERLQSELHTCFAPDGHAVRVVAPPERNFSTWIGASIVGTYTALGGHWQHLPLAREEYLEYGPSALFCK